MSASVQLSCKTAEQVPTDGVEELRCTFAGGFAPISVLVEACVEGEWHKVGVIYPEDTNKAQTFRYVATGACTHARLQSHAQKPADQLRVQLSGSTDGFGRVIVYDLGLWSA